MDGTRVVRHFPGRDGDLAWDGRRKRHCPSSHRGEAWLTSQLGHRRILRARSRPVSSLAGKSAVRKCNGLPSQRPLEVGEGAGEAVGLRRVSRLAPPAEPVGRPGHGRTGVKPGRRGWWADATRRGGAYELEGDRQRPVAESTPVWRPVPRGLDLDRICCLYTEATVLNNNTVRK